MEDKKQFYLGKTKKPKISANFAGNFAGDYDSVT